MASVELPPELLAGRAEAGADEVSSEALAVTDGLDVDVITGNMLPTFSAGTVEVEAAAAVGLGAVIGAPTGIDGSAAGAAGDGAAWDGADRDDGAADPVDTVAEPAVTDTTPVACALVAGFVAAPAEAVRLTHTAPLDGVPIPALRLNNDGVTSVPNDPS